MAQNIVTRFPPSPTGFLHIGRARTALFNYFLAKKNKGAMIFRFEDTDKARSKKEFEEDIIECLGWLGITWDNKTIPRQSERVEIYKKYLKKLVDENKAYISKEKIEDGEKAGQENEVVRFRNPNKKITFTDLIRGEITIDTEDLKDFIIARNINEPLYHLAVVIDDFEMGITHIIRGDDGISNTPRQILIQEAIGAPKPVYAHLPLILAPDKSKLSGRHGAVSVTDYRAKGYLPEALVNYLALLGWNPGTEQEIFTMDELIQEFDLSKVQKGGAIFNEEKLRWFNKEHLKRHPDALTMVKNRLTKHLASDDEEMLKRISATVVERIEILSDIEEMAKAGDFEFYTKDPTYESKSLLWKNEPDQAKTKAHLEEAARTLGAVSNEDWNSANLRSALWPYAEKNGKGNVLWPTRYALSGKEKSPDPFTLMEILGKEKTLARLKTACEKLS